MGRANFEPESPPPPPPPRFQKWAGLLLLVWPAVLVVGGYVAWNRWGAQRLNQRFGSLRRENIHVPSPPPYVRANVLDRVYVDAGLEGISLLDSQASSQIARAFETNPWVRHVDRVRKFPQGEVEIHLTYRRPVALVPVNKSRHPEVEGPACFAVDEESVLLPSEDFLDERGRPLQTDQYMQLLIDDTDVYPSAGVGSPFGDERVLIASRLAGFLADHRQALNLLAIQVVEPNGPGLPTLVLVRNDQTRAIWGSPLGAESSEEVPAIVKLQRLSASGNGEVDLRSVTGTRRAQFGSEKMTNRPATNKSAVVPGLNR